MSIVCLFQSTHVFTQKFVPENGQCLVFIGQDMEATGGFKAYNNGYSDHFEIPAGITLYTNLSPGNASFGYYNKGLDGLKTQANWGAGTSCANCYLENPLYQHTAIAIGLSFVDNEVHVAQGKRDDLIKELATWIKKSQRPIFLRIGYEFDGWAWNHYKRRPYLKAWQRIHDIFQEMQVDNVAFVWQSKGTGSDQKILEKWYPGDALVDWVAYSYFGQPDQEMLTFARKHKKPVFIAEATPVRVIDQLYFNSDLKDKKTEKAIWNEWFIPFFNTLKNNADVIKAFSYINADWPSQPMWRNNPVFQKVDARLHMSSYISQEWKKELSKIRYLNANDRPWPSETNSSKEN